jgi:hypothetical protein
MHRFRSRLIGYCLYGFAVKEVSLSPNQEIIRQTSLLNESRVRRDNENQFRKANISSA